MPKETIIAPAQKPAAKVVLPERSRGKLLLPILLAIALVIVSGAAGYLYWQNTQLKKNPQEVAQQQIKDVVAKVSKLILLPTGETPTFATVTDPSLLKDQPFFDNSEKGDQLLIYTNAKKVILYRPSTNQIVDVAPINIGNSQATTSPPKAQPTTPTTGKNP